MKDPKFRELVDRAFGLSERAAKMQEEAVSLCNQAAELVPRSEQGPWDLRNPGKVLVAPLYGPAMQQERVLALGEIVLEDGFDFDGTHHLPVMAWYGVTGILVAVVVTPADRHAFFFEDFFNIAGTQQRLRALLFMAKGVLDFGTTLSVETLLVNEFKERSARESRLGAREMMQMPIVTQEQMMNQQMHAMLSGAPKVSGRAN